MNSKDNSPTNPKSPSEHTKLSRLNDLGEPSLKNLEGTTRLAGKYKGSETSKSTESKYPENTFNDRSKHDALMRKALENPIVAKEFFDMHLPKEIKAMFSSYTLNSHSAAKY